MSELDTIKAQINEINNKRIRYQTLKEQAVNQCKEIEQKYNISSVEELQALVAKANEEYSKAVTDAQAYVTQANATLSSYEGLLC